MTSAAETRTTPWAGGAPHVGTRPLAAHEAAALKRSAGLHVLLGSIAGVLATAGFLGFLILLAVLSPDEEQLPSWSAPLVVGCLLAVSLLALACGRGLFRGVRLFRDAAAGQVDLFAEQRRGRIVRRLEVLPHSGRVWSEDDQLVSGWQVARRQEVADLPAFAGVAAEWVEPIRAHDGVLVHVNQRALSSEEATEVRRARWRLCLRPLLFGLGLASWCFPVLIWCAWTGTFPTGHNGISLVLLVVVTVLAGANAVRAVKLLLRIRRDLQVGRVGIIRRPVDGGSELTDAAEAASVALGEATEFLPHSGLPWTHGGQPVPWRIGG